MAAAADSAKGLVEDDDEQSDTSLTPYIQVLQRWKVWQDNILLWYSTCTQLPCAWPSRTVQLFPHIRRAHIAPGLLQHAVLYGNCDEDDVPSLVLATVMVDDPSQPTPLHKETVAYTEPFTQHCSFTHTAGDVDRLRYCPSQPTLVATKCDGAALSLYDIDPALHLLEMEPSENDGVAQFMAHQDGEASGSSGPVSVLHATSQEGVSLAWGDLSAGGGSGAAGLRLFSGLLCGAVGEYAIREDGSLAEVCIRRGGHDGDATVSELAWGQPYEKHAVSYTSDSAEAGSAEAGTSSPGSVLLASAGTDGRTVLWDPRQLKPVLYAPRCRQDVNGVAFAPSAATTTTSGAGTDSAAPLLATAGNDGIVRVYDLRKLGGGRAATTATAAPALHRLKAHYCGVVQLAFSPHNRALLASSDVQGRVLLWELGRTIPLEEGLMSRPELLFAHVGHTLEVEDITWSTELYGTLASTAGELAPEVMKALRAHSDAEADLPHPPQAVQVWRPAADLLPPGPSSQLLGPPSLLTKEKKAVGRQAAS